MTEQDNNAAMPADQPDWSREIPRRYWDPPRRLMRSIRCHQAASGRFARIDRIYRTLQYRFWSIVTGADIPLNTQIGGGLSMPHPNGIVVHPDARIGCNCMLMQQVTLGQTAEPGAPTLKAGAYVGAGAKVLGQVIIGRGARIGANAVVLSDVPDHATAVGIPARVLPPHDPDDTAPDQADAPPMPPFGPADAHDPRR